MAGAAYNSIATADITGVASYSFSGLSGYRNYRLIYTLRIGDNIPVNVRFNNNLDASRYGSMRVNQLGNSGTSYTATFDSSTFIFCGNTAQDVGGNTFGQIDLYNASYSQNSPPRAKNGLIKHGSRNYSSSTGSNNYFTSFMWYDTDNPITSIQLFTTGGSTFSSNSIATLYGIDI